MTTLRSEILRSIPLRVQVVFVQQKVMESTTREPHPVTDLNAMKRDSRFQNPETALHNAKRTFNILAKTFQPATETHLWVGGRMLGWWDKAWPREVTIVNKKPATAIHNFFNYPVSTSKECKRDIVETFAALE